MGLIIPKMERYGNTNLLKLNWKEIDKLKKKKEPPAFLSEKWIKKINNLVFNIPEKVIYLIQRYFLMGKSEWELYPFIPIVDTFEREYCLSVSNSAIDIAFSLLSSYIWDVKKKKKTNYFEIFWVHTLFLIRFWENQTGKGLVLEKSHFDYIESLTNETNYEKRHKEKILKNRKESENYKKMHKTAMEIVKDVKENMEKCMKKYSIFRKSKRTFNKKKRR